jgi:hypothetical protein
MNDKFRGLMFLKTFLLLVFQSGVSKATLNTKISKNIPPYWEARGRYYQWFKTQ